MQVEVTMFPGQKLDVPPEEVTELRMLGVLVEKKSADKPAEKPAEKEGK
jgi:hypothetical protein